MSAAPSIFPVILKSDQKENKGHESTPREAIKRLHKPQQKLNQSQKDPSQSLHSAFCKTQCCHRERWANAWILMVKLLEKKCNGSTLDQHKNDSHIEWVFLPIHKENFPESLT